MTILAMFTESAVPRTLLEPTIKIYRLDTNALTIEDADMTEVGNGQYSYDFTAWDSDIDYSVICDSVTLTGSERYAYTIIPEQTDIKFIKNIEGGKWEITDNQMIFSDEDNDAVVAIFNLFNSDGDASEINVKKRERV